MITRRGLLVSAVPRRCRMRPGRRIRGGGARGLEPRSPDRRGRSARARPLRDARGQRPQRAGLALRPARVGRAHHPGLVAAHAGGRPRRPPPSPASAAPPRTSRSPPRPWGGRRRSSSWPTATARSRSTSPAGAPHAIRCSTPSWSAVHPLGICRPPACVGRAAGAGGGRRPARLPRRLRRRAGAHGAGARADRRGQCSPGRRSGLRARARRLDPQQQRGGGGDPRRALQRRHRQPDAAGMDRRRDLPPGVPRGRGTRAHRAGCALLGGPRGHRQRAGRPAALGAGRPRQPALRAAGDGARPALRLLNQPVEVAEMRASSPAGSGSRRCGPIWCCATARRRRCRSRCAARSRRCSPDGTEVGFDPGERSPYHPGNHRRGGAPRELHRPAQPARPSQPLPALRARLAARALRQGRRLRRGRHQPRPRGQRGARRQAAGARQRHQGDQRGRLGAQDAVGQDQRPRHPLLGARRGRPDGADGRPARPDHDPQGRQRQGRLRRRRHGLGDRGAKGRAESGSASR